MPRRRVCCKSHDPFKGKLVNLNLMQQRVLIGGVVVLALMALFPPWKETIDSHGYRSQRPSGYTFIGSPPRRTEGSHWGESIDMPRWLIPMAVVVVATGVGAWLLQGWKPEPPQKNWNKPDTSIKVIDAEHSPAPDARS
jgi:hypothetical protein